MMFWSETIKYNLLIELTVLYFGVLGLIKSPSV